MLEKTITLSPAHIGAHSALMKAYNETGNWDKLNKLAQETLQIIPGNPEAQNYLNASVTRKDRIQTLEEDAAKVPSAEKYLNLSLIFYQKGDYSKCIDACEKALAIRPDFADAYSNMCASYNQLKQWDKAVECCNKALKINPEHQLAKGNLNWAKKQTNQ
jgi:tetratricopeptide (TPR) repeat protein